MVADFNGCLRASSEVYNQPNERERKMEGMTKFGNIHLEVSIVKGFGIYNSEALLDEICEKISELEDKLASAAQNAIREIMPDALNEGIIVKAKDCIA